MKPFKTSLLIFALSALSGLAVGYLAGGYLRADPQPSIHAIRTEAANRAARAQELMQILSDARSDNTTDVIRASESALDRLIIELAPSKTISGIASQQDRATLQTISKYRATVSYSPDPKIQPIVSTALSQ
jgi:hypothetical protein